MKKKVLYIIVTIIIITSGALAVSEYIVEDEEQNLDDNIDNKNMENTTYKNSTKEQKNLTLEDIDLSNYDGIQGSSESITVNSEELVSSHMSTISELNSSTMLLNSPNSSRKVSIQGDRYLIEKRSTDTQSVNYSDGIYEYTSIGNAIDGTYYKISQYNSSNSHKGIYPQERVKSLLEKSEVIESRVENRRILLTMNYTEKEQMEKLLDINSLESYNLIVRVNSRGLIELLTTEYKENLNSGNYPRSETYKINRPDNTEVTPPIWINKAESFDSPVRIDIGDSKITFEDTVGNNALENFTVSVSKETNNTTSTISRTVNRSLNNTDKIYVTSTSQGLTVTTDSSDSGNINTDKIDGVFIEDSRGFQYSYDSQRTQDNQNPYEQNELKVTKRDPRELGNR
jgi:hypothetical protein